MMPKLDDFQFNNFEMNDKNNNNNFQLHLIVNNLSKYLVHLIREAFKNKPIWLISRV